MGKSSGDSETKVKIPGFAKDALKSGIGAAGSLFGQGPQQFFPGQTFANFDPLQTQGQQAQLNFAESFLPGLNEQIFGSFGNALNAGDIFNDPSVQAGLGTIESRANQNFAENTLPSLRRAGIGAGQEFGTRPELAAGVAASRLGRDVGDAQAQFLANQLGSARQLQGAGLAISPQIQGLGLTQGNIFGDVGAQRQGMEQLGISEDVDRFNFGQQAPSALTQQYVNQIAQLAGGVPAGQSTSQGGSGTLGNILGGGLLGAGIGSSIPGFGAGAGTAFGPAGLGLGIGGAILGGLFS